MWYRTGVCTATASAYRGPAVDRTRLRDRALADGPAETRHPARSPLEPLAPRDPRGVGVDAAHKTRHEQIPHRPVVRVALAHLVTERTEQLSRLVHSPAHRL